MSKTIADLRNTLFATLDALSNSENPMDLERARVIADVGQVIVNSAKVEVDFIKATGSRQSAFLEPPTMLDLPARTHDVVALPSTGNGITSITQHRLKG